MYITKWFLCWKLTSKVRSIVKVSMVLLLILLFVVVLSLSLV